MTPQVRAFLRPLFLTNREAGPPQVELGPGRLRIADMMLRFGTEDQPGLNTDMDLLRGADDLHLLQIYHVIYPPGIRILTLNRHSPLILVYREIESLTLRLV